jgi:tetratricopeptide (TPR) repeat protein
MGRKYFYWLLIFLGGFSFLGMQTVAGSALGTGTKADNIIQPDNFLAQYDLAQELYETAGLADYFGQRSLLWTETHKRRNELASKLPVIPLAQIEQFQAQVFHLLELNSDYLEGLILAGDYHFFCRQKQTALWYYQKAKSLAPYSEMANLALADFYLNEWQPGRVRELLAGFRSPAAMLRKGAACLQAGEYPLALGYLIQADPLPPMWQITRDKDLYKTYLALGETKQANLLVKEVHLQTALCGTIFRELLGWSAWFAGDRKGALSNWQAGEMLNSGYKLWGSYIEWLQPDRHMSSANITRDFHDPDLNAAYEISQGQELFKEDQWDLAYKAYLAAIRHDHFSLIGFLGAATVKLNKKDYNKALELCNQGLALNPDFGPLLVKRAETFEKLGRFNEADNDRAKALNVSGNDALLHPKLVQNAGRSVILVQGDLKDLVGFWVSAEGIHWKWYPWWGGPVTLGNRLTKAWVLPSGPGLSGKAFYLEKEQEVTAIIQIGSPQPHDKFITIQLPFPAKLEVEFYDQHKLLSYVGDQFSMEHQIPVSVFPDGGSVPLQIRWQNEAGLWGTFAGTLDLPTSIAKPPVEYTISTETFVVNHRRIRLYLSSAGGPIDDVMVSLREEEAMTDWIPFQPSINYTLSSGDGLKTVIAQFRDRTGNTEEVSLSIELDTQAPTIDILGNNMVNRKTMRLKWSANGAVTSKLKILTAQGNWLEIPALTGQDGVYSGDFPLKSGVFCQIAAEDSAGNIRLTTVENLNTQLREAATTVFEVNGGTNRASSRWITLKPNIVDIKWVVSNDFSSWSDWQQGDDALKWRINPGLGEHLIFIKYQTAAENLVHYQVLTVFIAPDLY